ncbi:MAG: MFS transporter [Hyphomicrobium sp.]
MHSPAVATEGAVREAAPLRARTSWVMFDWSAQPYYTLVLTFLFAPYFANIVVGDGGTAASAVQAAGECGEQQKAWGQALWGYAAAAAGVLIAIGSPLLGALADGRGRRKPWIALFSLVFVASLSVLWLAVPAASQATIWLVLAAFVVATAAIEFTTVFTNAMMPTLVPQDQMGRLSGLGYAVGYAGGLVSLAIMAGLIVADPATGKTIIGLDPLLALNTASREGDRFVGPFAAGWFLVFMLPFFLFVPDVRPVARPLGVNSHSAGRELWATVKALPQDRDMLLFLVARMIYADGLSAIFAFGGIYGAAVFGWGPLELGIFGIILSITGMFGALIGGPLDDRLGSKTVIIGSLLLLTAGAIGILSIDKTHILFTTEVEPKAPGSSPFSSIGERMFLAFAILLGVVAAPVQAASRTLLARLAPPDKITQYFGLFAFSGKVTAFAAPFAVATVTALTCSQRYGMAAILAFLVLGILLMIPVRENRKLSNPTARQS